MGAAATALAVRGAQRRWAIAASAALVVAAGLCTVSQRDLWLVRHHWDSWRRDAAVHGLEALHRAIDEAASASSRAATAALDAPDDRMRAFGDLARFTSSNTERGVVLFRGDSAFAWAGTIRPPIDATTGGAAIIATPFYLALQFATHGTKQAAASVALLGAVPPADRLSTPLANHVATQTGLSGFIFLPPVDTGRSAEVLHYALGGRRLFDVTAAPLVQDQVEQRIEERVRGRAGIAFVIALGCFIIGVWRGTRRLSDRVAALAVGLACTALVPLSQYSNLTRLFDPTIYFTPRGGPLTGNAGALGATSALVLLGVLAVFRRRAQPLSRWTAIVTILVVAIAGPFLLREIARGVKLPPHGLDTSLWLMWEIPTFLAAVSVMLAGAAAGATVLGPRRGLPPWVAPLVAAVSAALAPLVWEAPGRFPWWYTILWIVGIALLALSRRTRYVILSASTVAALGATTLIWGRTARGRVEAAGRDLQSLSQTDSVALGLLRRFGASLLLDSAPNTRQALLQHYVTSDIAAAGNPIWLFAFPRDSSPVADFKTATIPIPRDAIARLVTRARQTGTVMLAAVPTDTAVELAMAAPSVSGGVTAAVLAPRSRLFESDPFARLLGLDVDADVEPPYTVRLHEVPVPPGAGADTGAKWRRDGSQIHGDWVVRTGTRAVPAHVEVELRPLNALVQRGTLIVLLDLLLVGALWLASVVADGGGGRWLRARRRTWGRSYRAQLSWALFAFFVVPAAAFAIWSYGNLSQGATQSRQLLVNETLRALVPPPLAPLAAESNRLDTPLLLYRAGELHEASDGLYEQLAPIGRFLPPHVEITVAVRDEETDTDLERVDGTRALFGYRAFTALNAPTTVIAAPARADELVLGRRRRDLGVLVLFATALGAVAAFWLSGFAARQLARPIGTLREAALSIAGGARSPRLETEPPVEFNPVFAAFRRMAADLTASRSALEEAQRRTAAVLRNVASGVVAVDLDGRVSLANPRAELLLGGPLPPGTDFRLRAAAPIAEAVERFLGSPRDEQDFEVSLDQQQLRGTLTRLDRGGAVVTLDDVTELARAQRVLAWGEMARQVAHEIKNPLTPIRLGVQHLRRARNDARVDFDRVLEHNVNQILTEIDRLDEIARSFSRYGAAPEERGQPQSVDVAAIVREVVSLERMGGSDAIEWAEAGVDAPVFALARADELKEVLLNVLENARHAQARQVAVTVGRGAAGGEGDMRPTVSVVVRDDGHGIPADVLPRVFEPHFSTRTSGSGLGLAISRQLVERWGGEITVASAPGRGTTVSITLLSS